jgi:hypothetical protein
MIHYIFQIGIIYIVFGLIWAFFILLYNMLMGFGSNNGWQTLLIKGVKMYFLISLVAIFTNSYMRMPQQSAPLIATVGLLTLYSYLVGRLQQQRMIVQINSRMGNFTKAPTVDMRSELLMVVAGLVYFTLCLYNKELPVNKANMWFYRTVTDIYDTPVIGWIIGFFGILFLISILLRAALATVMLLQRFQQLMSGQGNNNDRNDRNNSSGNDGYSDYEVVE